jgi:hypothetical protein
VRYSELSAAAVMMAAEKAYNHAANQNMNAYRDKTQMRHLKALAYAARLHHLNNGRMHVSSEDFVFIADFWEPPIHFNPILSISL